MAPPSVVTCPSCGQRQPEREGTQNCGRCAHSWQVEVALDLDEAEWWPSLLRRFDGAIPIALIAAGIGMWWLRFAYGTPGMLAMGDPERLARRAIMWTAGALLLAGVGGLLRRFDLLGHGLQSLFARGWAYQWLSLGLLVVAAIIALIFVPALGGGTGRSSPTPASTKPAQHIRLVTLGVSTMIPHDYVADPHRLGSVSSGKISWKTATFDHEDDSDIKLVLAIASTESDTTRIDPDVLVDQASGFARAFAAQIKPLSTISACTPAGGISNTYAECSSEDGQVAIACLFRRGLTACGVHLAANGVANKTTAHFVARMTKGGVR